MSEQHPKVVQIEVTADALTPKDEGQTIVFQYDEGKHWGDGELVSAVVEIVNEETYGWTDEQHEAEIERLKRLVESTYRAEWDYIVQKNGPTWTEGEDEE